MLFFTPRYLKEAKHYLHGAKKILNYRRDLLPTEAREDLEAAIDQLKGAIRARSREAVQKAQERLDQMVGRIAPAPDHPSWREHCEVFLVAIVIAAGVRCFYLQPFKIPTGSMQPTLNGLVGVPMDSPPPNLLVRAVEFLWLGRSYISVSAKQDEVVQALRERPPILNFFTFTDIICENNTYTVFSARNPLVSDFGVVPGKTYKKGDPIVRGYIDSGDMVFVNKMVYHFEKPKLGQVFVFKTNGIRKIQMGLPAGVQSQHYIKRLAGLPGDELRIAQPNLYIDGKIPTEWGFQQVMSLKNGYRGYANGSDGFGSFTYLGNADEIFTVPEKSYFALGDNSFNSSDSRNWGIVPAENLAGKGQFVFWPFSKRWGLIR